jgi:hypothetical protein
MTPGRVITVTCVASLTLAGCGGSTGRTPRRDTGAARPASTAPSPSTAAMAATAAISTSARRRPRRRHRAPDPGRLPQTRELPSSHTRSFHAEMQDLWAAVLTGRTGAAGSAFFPQTAYAQLKSIGDAAADWQDRLYADYRLDIAAAHALLSAPYASTDLIGVSVPGEYAHWVDPGVCENRIGYYEVPNARMIYREHGEVRSFGVASMISWRGRWYVIHLGFEGKLSIGGRVDAPSVGVGVSAPSSAC